MYHMALMCIETRTGNNFISRLDNLNIHKQIYIQTEGLDYINYNKLIQKF